VVLVVAATEHAATGESDKLSETNPRRRYEKGTAMSFGIYIVGFLILIGGLIYGAVILHLAAHWIAVGAIVLLGLAILNGVQATRQKDPSQ
jgi:cytochrome c biogenesis protein CcdA